MNTIKTIICCLGLSILLTACKESGNNNSTQITEAVTSEESSTSGPDSSASVPDSSIVEPQYNIDPGYTRFEVESVSALKTYEGKTKIVYLTNYGIEPSEYDEDPDLYDTVYIQNTVNDYLDKIGRDYYVEFIFNEEWPRNTNEIHPNYELYKQMLSDDQQVDIVNTGLGFDSLGGDTFHLFVKEGYLEPLNDYITTEEGKKLYEQFDDIIWALTTESDGKIYGKSSLYNVCMPLTVTINNSVMNQFGISINEIKELNDLEPYLKTLKENNISGLCLDSTNKLIPQLAGFTEYKGIYINAETGKAENIFENEKALSILRIIENFKNEGYLSKPSTDPEKTNPFSIDPALPLFYDTSNIISKGYLSTETLNCVVGISSNSKNKDKAFDLLMLLNTDKELADIIYNGTEGRNYIASNGVITPNRNAMPFIDKIKTMANPIIASANSQDNIHKESNVKNCWKNSIISPFFKFELPEELVEPVKTVAEINSKYYGMFYGNYGSYETLDKAIDAANTELKEANIDDVLDELNKAKEKEL